jgi:hypothetical protein
MPLLRGTPIARDGTPVPAAYAIRYLAVSSCGSRLAVLPGTSRRDGPARHLLTGTLTVDYLMRDAALGIA